MRKPGWEPLGPLGTDIEAVSSEISLRRGSARLLWAAPRARCWGGGGTGAIAEAKLGPTLASSPAALCALLPGRLTVTTEMACAQQPHWCYVGVWFDAVRPAHRITDAVRQEREHCFGPAAWVDERAFVGRYHNIGWRWSDGPSPAVPGVARAARLIP